MISPILDEYYPALVSKDISIAYGETGLSITVPDGTHIILAAQLPDLFSEPDALRHGLRNPMQSPPQREQVESDLRILTKFKMYILSGFLSIFLPLLPMISCAHPYGKMGLKADKATHT